MRDKYTVYTMPNCPDCKNAKQLLETRGCEFEEVTDFTPNELRALVGPVRSLPQIILDQGGARFHIGGFKDLQSYLTGQLAGRRLD
ncbi:glutaredoxin 3 [Pseudomonas phage hairong]|nr:glutaredoxin 3 [Pseudomonas phage hairong]